MKYLKTACHLALAAALYATLLAGQDYKRGLTMITPSDQWREALPSGNGMIGALVYGSIHRERILFNHNQLWYQGNIADIPDMSAELPVVRQLMLEGKYFEANDHYRNVMRDKGFDGKNAVYHPAFDMLVTTDTEHLFQNYKRTLDFETGEVSVRWKDGDTQISRKLFVSIPDDLSVMSITSDKNNALSGSVTLDIHDLRDSILQDGSLFDPGFTYETRAVDGFIEFRADGSDGGEFGGVVRVIVKNGESSVSSVSGGSGRRGRNIQGIRYRNADEVLLVVGFYANEAGEVAIPQLKDKLATIDTDYDILFARHKPLHYEKFNSMGVSLNLTGNRNTPNEQLLLDAYQGMASPELIEKLFDYGRYLLISSSREGGQPANLQGIWNGDYRPPWNSLYGINENLQITYWQAIPGNMKESMMAFFDYFDAHLDDFRYNAKQLWGCDGIYIPPFMSPESGIMRHTAPHVVNWTDAAGWLASFYYDYYLVTGDEEFLRNRAIPFMKEVALFYEDFIVKDEQGKNMFFPSQSPENQPPDLVIRDPRTGRESGVKVQINSAITVAICKEVMTSLVVSCERLGLEKNGVKRWKQVLADMPKYQVNEDGAMREWLHPDFKDNYEHRHISHIYPVFPGHEVTAESNPEIYEACLVAIQKRLTVGLGSQTGWSLAHNANIYARMGDGDGAFETMNILARCCLGKNFFTYHNDWRKMGVTLDMLWGRTAPFQMDANFGISAAVIEMLCGSSKDVLKILPALPSGWDAGAFHGILTRAGARTSVNWDFAQKELHVWLKAERDARFDLKFPGDISMLNCSQPHAVKHSKHGDDYRFVSLKKGESISIQAKLKQYHPTKGGYSSLGGDL
ncbi:MAG: glycoside hydrolase N-terminal domain-containing protein [Puniceicoccaceae bacterium]